MKTIFLSICSMLLVGAVQAQTWNGSSSDDWGTSSNWTPNSVPGSSSNVTIPSSLSTYPKLGANVTIASLSMQSGSALNLNGKTFTMTGNLSIQSATVSGSGSFSSTGAGSVNVQSSTITTTLSITGYTGSGYIYDNSITGNTTISNASGQAGDNFIDGNTFTGTLTLTQASNNNEMDEGYGSPSSTKNHITGNASFTCTGTKNFYTSYSRPTQFDADFSISHTGSGGVIAFNSGGSVGGNFSLSSPSGSGSNQINSSAVSKVPITGTVTITVANGQYFDMRWVVNNTSGGSVSVTGPSSVQLRNDTLLSSLSVTNYSGYAYIYDNTIVGNSVISNVSGQAGDNFIDGNTFTGTLTLTQASNNNEMSEGYGSPSSTKNHITGNASFTCSGNKALHTSYSRATQFDADFSISNTGSGGVEAFKSGGSVGGNFSLSSLSGSGSNQINSGAVSKVPVTGTVTITVANGQYFDMRWVVNNTSGGSVSVTGPSSVQLRNDTLLSSLSVTSYTGSAYIYDNTIIGNSVISNVSGQAGDNFIDGNTFTGTLTLTQASNNNDMREGYGSPSSTKNHITGNASFTCSGNKLLVTSFSRATQFDADLSISHTGSGGVEAFTSGGSVGGNFSLNSPSGSGYNNINAVANSVVPVTGTVNVTIANGQAFNMQRIKNNTLGGAVNVTSPSYVNFKNDTLKSNVSIFGYTGNGYIYDNNITGNAVFSNTTTQVGDNFIDGNNISGTFSLTQASVNNEMYEGYGSPSSHANVIGGNTTMYLSGNKSLHSSFSRPTLFGGYLTVSHSGSGDLRLFEASASIDGNFSLTSSAGSDYLNAGFSPKIPVGGTVNISVTSRGNFVMQNVVNSTSGGTVSIDSPAAVTLRADTLKSIVSVTGYANASYFYDNSITGNFSISNRSTQTGDNNIDGNNITGDFSLTQSSANNDMYEGFGSPNSLADVIGGNTTMYLTSNTTLHSSYSRPTQFGGNLTVSHTGSGTLGLFENSASIGGNFSLTSSAGGDYLNGNFQPKIPVGGTVNISVTSRGNFLMQNVVNSTSGGTVNIDSPAAVTLRSDTLKSNVSVTGYASSSYFYDNSITGNFSISNRSTQGGDNFIDGNNITGDFSLTHTSANNDMYEGYGSPSSHGSHVGGNTILNFYSNKSLYTDYTHSGAYDGNFTVSHTGSGTLTLFYTNATIGGNLNINATSTAGLLYMNPNGSDIVDVTGSVRVIKNNPNLFLMYNIRNHGAPDTVSITGNTNNLDMRNDTLNSVVLLKNFSGNFYLYNNRINGETLIADASSKSGDFKFDDNFFNGRFSLVHSSSNIAYDGAGGSGYGNRVSGRDSIVNLSGAGNISMCYSHSHKADSSFILNSAGGVGFSISNPVYFSGATNGSVRNYGSQALSLPLLTLAKTGNTTMNLEAPLSITNTLTLTSGFISSHPATPLTFTSGAGYSGGSTTSHVTGFIAKVGNTAFTFPIGNGTYYAPCGITAPSASTDTFSAQYLLHNPGNDGYDSTQKVSTLNHLSRCEYWIINRGTSSSSNVKVTLGFTQHSGVNNLSDLTIAHWYAGGSGTKWYDEGNGSTTGTVTNGTITSNNTISSFSPFTLASTTNNNPLPVTLIDFNVSASGHSAIITWRSGLELGDETFLVQRSTDGEHFITLGTQAAMGTGHNYSFVDPMPADGLNYYRLAIEEPGKPLDYSAIKLLRFGQSGQATDILLYPNPATESIFVDGLAQHAGATLSIRNIVGQLLFQETLSADPRVEISLHNLPAGVYQLQIDDAQGSFYRQRFIRQ